VDKYEVRPTSARERSRAASSMLGLRRPGLPQDVLGRLQLERRVVDVEVVRQAFAKVVEDISCSDHDVVQGSVQGSPRHGERTLERTVVRFVR
jgi:hypothetical protein